MIRGAVGIVGVGLMVWVVGCGTHSGIGNLGVGGSGGGDVAGTGGTFGMGGFTIGLGGDLGAGGMFITGSGGSGTGGLSGSGGANTGGSRASCPAVIPPLGPAKSLGFAAPADYDTGAGAYGVTTGDLNGDGKIDLVLLDYSAGARLMLNKGDGTFGAPANLAFVQNPYNVAVGDLDGDGNADIVGVSPFGVSVLINKGGAAFRPPVNYVVGAQSFDLALGDLNGDGKLDIAVVDPGDGTSVGDVGILLNAGSGTFEAANYPASRVPAAIAIGDMDNDCQPDLVLVGPSGVTVLPNNAGHFPTATTFGNGTSGNSVAVADLNADGKLDVVEGTGAASGNGLTYVFINRGFGSFNAPITYALSGTLNGANSPAGGDSVVLADLNGDGRPDLLSLASCCGLGVLPNHGDGTFPTSVNFPTAPFPYWLAASDLNGDGLPDVAVVSSDGGTVSRLRVLINTSH